MSESLSVRVHVRRLEGERIELVLRSAETAGSWSKIYDGALFLSMDAQALELLEELPLSSGGGPRYRLRKAGTIQIEQLNRMHFAMARE